MMRMKVEVVVVEVAAAAALQQSIVSRVSVFMLGC